MNKVTFIISIIVLAIFLCMNSRIDSLKEDLSNAENNNKAYQQELINLRGESTMYKFTIEQLEYFNDSIVEKLKEAKEELNIKDKNIKQLQYLNSKTSKKDTIVLTDTIFKNDICLDTAFGDKWYNIKLGLRYPDTLIVNPSFTNETLVFVSSKKETINPPKKWWWQRLFQKKHTIIKVDVVENNPYTNVKNQKFIEIIK